MGRDRELDGVSEEQCRPDDFRRLEPEKTGSIPGRVTEPAPTPVRPTARAMMNPTRKLIDEPSYYRMVL